MEKLLSLVIISSTFQKTFWYVGGIRLLLSDVLMLVFVISYIIFKLANKTFNLSEISRNYALINIPLIMCMLFGYIYALMVQPVTSIELFLKGILLFSFYLIFQVFAIDAISQIGSEKQYYFPVSFLIGGLISVFYNLIQACGYYYYNTDIDLVYLEKIFSESWHVGFEEFGQLYRMSGLLADPNHLGIVIIVSVGIVMGFLSYYNKVYDKTILMGSLLVLFITLIYTFSRSSIIAFLIATLCMLFFGKKLKMGLVKVFSILFSFTIIIMLLIYIQSDALRSVIVFKLDFSTTSIMQRKELFYANLDIWLNNILLGVGHNNYSSAYFALTGIERYNAHNTWITYLIELGIIGFVFYLGIYYYILRSAWVTIYSSNRLYSVLGTVYFSFYIGIMVGNLFYNTMQWNYVIVFQVMILGLRGKEWADCHNL